MRVPHASRLSRLGAGRRTGGRPPPPPFAPPLLQVPSVTWLLHGCYTPLLQVPSVNVPDVASRPLHGCRTPLTFRSPCHGHVTAPLTFRSRRLAPPPAPSQLVCHARSQGADCSLPAVTDGSSFGDVAMLPALSAMKSPPPPPPPREAHAAAAIAARTHWRSSKPGVEAAAGVLEEHPAL